MVVSKVNSTKGLSWADEVEKEEAAARNHSHERRRKPNPFGSARPREVVLEEKGIDWRKLDQKLIDPSSEPRKEKLTKDNGLAPRAPVHEKQPRPATTRSLDGNIRSARNGTERSSVSPGRLPVQNQAIHVIGPPLLFPPKNVIVTKDIHNSSYARADAKLPNWGEFDMQREDVIRELSPHRSRHFGRRENHNEWEDNSIIEDRRRNLAVEELRHRAGGERHGARGMRMSEIHRDWEWENMNPDYDRRDFSEEQLVGSRLAKGRRNSLPDYERGRRAADEDFFRNMENEYRRVNNIAERRMRRSPNDIPPNEGRHGYHGVDNGKPGFREKTRPKPRLNEEGEGAWRGTVDGRRVPDQRSDMEREGFNTNRKRGMLPASNNPCTNQRRRR